MRILTANARVLLAVLEHPDKTQREIEKMLNMHYQHVWRALDRLVKENILEKHRENRRTYFVAGGRLFWEIDQTPKGLRHLTECVILTQMAKILYYDRDRTEP